MDPNETLRQIRQLLNVRRLNRQQIEQFQELVEALDEWMSNGGCAPIAWSGKKMMTQSVSRGVSGEQVTTFGTNWPINSGRRR